VVRRRLNPGTMSIFIKSEVSRGMSIYAKIRGATWCISSTTAMHTAIHTYTYPLGIYVYANADQFV
jgi:hypothetical protein